MEFNTHIVVAVALHILGDDEIAVPKSEVRVADIGLYYQVAFLVVATRSAYHVDKGLVVAVLYGQVLGLRLAPVILDMYLVGACKGHTVVVVGKLTGDVEPQQG